MILFRNRGETGWQQAKPGVTYQEAVERATERVANSGGGVEVIEVTVVHETRVRPKTLTAADQVIVEVIS